MDWDEPHPTSNEKMQPIQWTTRPTGALVAAGSLWPVLWCPQPNSLFVKELGKHVINGQSEPAATNAPIGRSVHWMGYVFSFGQMGFIIVPPHFFLLINYVFFFCGCFVAVFPLDLTSHLPCSLSYPHKYCTNLGTLFIIPY
jgi:hypothetical protein